MLFRSRAHPVRSAKDGACVLLVQAGTGLSTRLRGEENDFNLLTIDGPEVAVERHVAGSKPEFHLADTTRFRRDGGEWHSLPD